MVGVSYHELNAGTQRTERHTVGERKQFLVVCVIGVAVLLNAFINAGLFEEVVIKDGGVFLGGEYIYKISDRDYAATGGTWRSIRQDLKTDQHLEDDKSFDDKLYAVYIDDVTTSNGRFFSGLLTSEDSSANGKKHEDSALNSDHSMKQRLLDSPNREMSDFQRKERNEFERREYIIGTLPSVKCAVATFPYTDGFVSALLTNYKVFPTIAKYVKKMAKGKLIISTTCNRDKQMCTHYIPLEDGDGEKFLIGHQSTETYLLGVNKDDISLDPRKILKGLKKLAGMGEEL
mmetsp:Transcript_12187/g.18415  ORF Transcript_12187/g.18415 Transcript_12187/m.18415 type:complete len:289 (-) Transcript_12187:168-1034(-)